MSTYGPHPDNDLQKVSKGLQGASLCCEDGTRYPMRDDNREVGCGNIVFLGLDANWPYPIDPALRSAVLTYLKNPVAYWKANHPPYPAPSYTVFRPIHHPLLSAHNPGPYRGGGLNFHQNFNRLHLPAHPYADCVSFAELLAIPTRGSTTTSLPVFRDLVTDPANYAHLHILEKCLFRQGPKTIYLSNSVLKALRRLKGGSVAPNLSQYVHAFSGSLNAHTPPIIAVHNSAGVAAGVEIYLTYHFSAQGNEWFFDHNGPLRAHIDAQCKRVGCC